MKDDLPDRETARHSHPCKAESFKGFTIIMIHDEKSKSK